MLVSVIKLIILCYIYAGIKYTLMTYLSLTVYYEHDIFTPLDTTESTI